MTENKATSTTCKYIIKPVSASESKNALKESKKLQVKNTIIDKLNDAILTANKSVDELTLKPLQRIFSTTPNKKTLIQVRYGSKVFYDGIIDDMIIKGSSKTPNELKNDNYQAKKEILNQILATMNNDSEFSALYETFLNKKTSSAKTSAKKSTSKKSKAKTETN